jgi:hypothetical protein
MSTIDYVCENLTGMSDLIVPMNMERDHWTLECFKLHAFVQYASAFMGARLKNIQNTLNLLW